MMEVKDKWLLERRGKFTASEIYKLLSGGKGEMFGAGAKTYIRQKVIETITVLWERPELEQHKNLLHGKAHELPAFENYCKFTKNYDMRYFGTDDPLFLIHADHPSDAGGSPDGLMGQDTDIYLGLELKCPINPSIHFDYIQFRDQFDLKAYNLAYYAQIQFLMMITKAELFHFCSYDSRFFNAKDRIKVIEVKPERNFMSELDIRLSMAVKDKWQQLETHKNRAA